MANIQHLDILKQGVEVWNRWRQEHTDIQPDLSQADLSQTILSQTDLSRVNLSRAKLSGADLSRADLSQTDLSGVNLSQSDLSQSDLSQSDLSGANPETALSLRDTRMRAVIGLTKEQLEACRSKGAIIEETSAPPPIRQLVAEVDLRGAVSDAPKTDSKDDRLGFKPYVDVLYGFITALETTTPLVISINGSWGMGKSSLMGMLKGQLEPQGGYYWDMYWQGIAWHVGQLGRKKLTDAQKKDKNSSDSE